MVSRARLKSILTGLALYAMAAAIVGYFGVNAYTGKYGLNARQELDQEIIALTSELAQLKRERARSEQRVSLLRSARIDPDMLDERARFQLDYVNPRDLVRKPAPSPAASFSITPKVARPQSLCRLDAAAPARAWLVRRTAPQD
jgi:cell division protein FtsB